MPIIIALAIILGAITAPASADWPSNAFNCRAYRADLYWQGWARRHCPGWRRWTRRHVPYRAADALCQPIIEVTGEQAQDKPAARTNAITAWRSRVRFKYGERFADFEMAREPARAVRTVEHPRCVPRPEVAAIASVRAVGSAVQGRAEEVEGAMSDGKLIYLAFTSERQRNDEMNFLACRVCRNKTYTHTYVGDSGFPLVRCAACGQHIGRVGWADEGDLQAGGK